MTKYLTLSLSALIFLSGCKGYHHAATPHFTPVFTKKNQLAVGTAFNHYHLGYSINEHLFIVNSGFYRSINNINPFRGAGKEGSGQKTRTEHSYEMNGGIGYLLGMTKRTQFLVTSGGGWGRINTSYEEAFRKPYVSNLDAQTAHFFIQPSFNWTPPDDPTTLSISTKFTGLFFNSISSDTQAGDVKTIYKEDLPFLNTSRTHFFFLEPALTFKTGKRVKFESQLIAPINLSNSSLRYKSLAINLGLSFNIALDKK